MSETGFLGVPVASDAPDVMISSVDVVRSIVQPQDDEEAWKSWVIQCQTYPDAERGRHVRFFGNLSIYEEGWFIGVTTVVGVQFRGKALPEFDDWTPARTNEYNQRYGAWVSHVLYDVAAACARRLSVQSFVGGPAIPVETPEAELVMAEIPEDGPLTGDE